jgi:DnaK suppressor protein
MERLFKTFFQKHVLFMTAYSKQELQEFKELILQKHRNAQEEYTEILQQLNDNSTKDTDPVWFNANHISEISAREEMSINAARLKKFMDSLSMALARIENGTYGICTKTGNLIPKDRLKAVPHATMCVEAKLRDAR